MDPMKEGYEPETVEVILSRCCSKPVTERKEGYNTAIRYQDPGKPKVVVDDRGWHKFYCSQCHNECQVKPGVVTVVSGPRPRVSRSKEPGSLLDGLPPA